MKIALIATGSLIEHGIRSLSSTLKSKGHEVICVFFARWECYLRLSHEEFIKKDFPDVRKLLKDCDLIGISCLSFNYYHALHVAASLRDLNKPFVIGGIHASLCPEECIKHFDIVCVGEGTEAFPDLIDKIQNKEDIYNTANFWFRKDDEIIKNPPRPLIEDLDVLPTPDYDFSQHYLYDGNKLTALTPAYFKSVRYYTIYGCPHNCYFCSNLFLYQAFVNDKSCNHVKIRKKSIPKIMNDLEIILKNFDPAIPVTFDDDTFFIRTHSEIEDFAKEYKNRINHPFHVSTCPLSFDEKKLELLIEAGLATIDMGIQSGSEKTNFELFNRKMKTKRIMEVVQIINNHKDSIKNTPLFSIIIDNPYENKYDKMETLKLFHSLPKPYELMACHLQFLPKTKIYEKALEDGLINSLEEELEYLNKSVSYFHHIDPIKGTVSIDDIFILMAILGKNVSNQFYGILPPRLVDSFINRPIETIPENLKVIITRNLVEKLPKDNKMFLYILKVVTMLRNVPERIDDKLSVIEASLEDFNFTKQMMGNYNYYTRMSE